MPRERAPGGGELVAEDGEGLGDLPELSGQRICG